MATLAPARSASPPIGISVEGIRLALLWLTGFSGAFVFIEPSPYEVMSLFTAIVFAASGLTLQAALIPLVDFFTQRIEVSLHSLLFLVAERQVLGKTPDCRCVPVDQVLVAGADEIRH